MISHASPGAEDQPLGEKVMNTHIAYCSACDRDVRIMLPDEPVFDGQANVADPEIVCLEIGDGCTGSLCPIGAQPPRVMKARLVKSGVSLRLQPFVRAYCEACSGDSDFVLIDREYATCPGCGRTVARNTLS